MIFKKYLPLIIIITALTTTCQLPVKSSQARRPFWGDSINTVILLEKNRLGTDPVERYQSSNGYYKGLKYDDRIFSKDSSLFYYFEKDKLVFMLYSSSDPDWNKEELNFQVHNKLSSLYGEPQEKKLGVKTCYHWTASDAYIYYAFVRKHQDRNFWRGFLAVLVYSSQTLEESDYLRSALDRIRQYK